eukprot:COSAG02_NODE_52846_length_305_cov_0.995146_1_plen_20_part_10
MVCVEINENIGDYLQCAVRS